MGETFEQFADLHFDAQFLAQLARKTFFEGFGPLAFAAGKFPQAAQVGIGMTLGDKQLSIAKDQSGADFDGFQGRVTYCVLRVPKRWKSVCRGKYSRNTEHPPC